MPYMGHDKKSMHDEFVRHRNYARVFLAADVKDLYKNEIALAAAFLEAAMTFPF